MEEKQIRIVYCSKCGDSHYAPLFPKNYKFCTLCGAATNVAILSVIKGKLRIISDQTTAAYINITKE